MQKVHYSPRKWSKKLHIILLIHYSDIKDGDVYMLCLQISDFLHRQYSYNGYNGHKVVIEIMFY
jgi:hypothetical protein